MDREEFNNLTLEQQIKEVNEKLKYGITLVDISNELGINESTLRTRFNKGGYKRIDNCFVLKDIVESKNENTKLKEKNIIKSKNKDIRDTKNLDEQLSELKKQFEELRKLINNDKNIVKEENKDEKLEIKEFNSAIVQRPVRLYDEVYEKLEKVFSQYSYYKKYQILNTLLDEILDKYL